MRSGIVQELKEPEWDWEKEAYYSLGEGYGVRAAIDPFPSYQHSLITTSRMLDRLQAIIAIPVTIYLLPFELKSRVNGFTDIQYLNWSQDNGYTDAKHIIALSGKRTPIPTGMTEYLMAHEYGHAIEHFISYKLKNDELRVDYAKMRGLDINRDYGTGGNWTDASGEVFADDFRVIYAGVEPDFWPHTVEAPTVDNIHDIHNWWIEKINELDKVINYVC